MTHADSQLLWARIEQRLNTSLPDWRARIDHFGQVAAAEQRAAGRVWTDAEVFDALLRAVLSGASEWAKVERVLAAMKNLFYEFELCRYGAVTETEVRSRFIPWFEARRAGSPTLAAGLIALTDTSGRLCRWSEQLGSAESYFTTVLQSVASDPKAAAVELGGHSRRWKLRGLGVPLAAEALRNLGFDLAKPDRHVNRAFGSFGFVQFRNWKDRVGTKAPAASEPEMVAVMNAAEHLAGELSLRVSFVDNAIWMLCAKQPSGLFTSNAELARLAA